LRGKMLTIIQYFHILYSIGRNVDGFGPVQAFLRAVYHTGKTVKLAIKLLWVMRRG
jgi:hypothetical protein